MKKQSIVIKLIYITALICLIALTALFSACSGSNSPGGGQQYVFTASSVPDIAGTITPANGTFAAGSNVDISAVPVSGYQFDYWEGDVTGTDPSVKLVMDKEKNVIAHFKALPPSKYLLEVAVEPAGAGTINPGSDIYESGNTATATASPLPGYGFDYWSGDVESKSPSVNITMDDKKKITAHFKSIFSLKITASPDGSGTISPSTGNYGLGESVKVTATPARGYAFDHWSGDTEAATNPQAVIMDKNRSLVAHFIPTEIDIKEGINKGLIAAVFSGSGYINYIKVKMTSNCNVTITVIVPAGTICIPSQTGARFSRMITTEERSLAVPPGAPGQMQLPVVTVDMMNNAPGEGDSLFLKEMTQPDDLKLLLKSSDFISANFRVKQYAIWLITDYPQRITEVKIGVNKDYKGPSKDELNTIKSIFQKAGISLDKYPEINVLD